MTAHAASLPPPASHAATASDWFAFRARDSRASALLGLGSVILHVGGLALMATLPPTLPAAAPEHVFDVTLTPLLADPEPVAPIPEPVEPSVMPEGSINARSFAARSEKAPARADDSSDVSDGSDEPQVDTAPILASAVNPYASPSFAMPSGTGNRLPSSRLASSRRRVTHTVGATSAGAPLGVAGGTGPATRATQQALADWRVQVRRVLVSRGVRRYPSSARALGHQGTVRLSVTIEPSGRIAGVSVAASSGFPRLDSAAADGVRLVSQVPAPPAGVPTTRLTVPIAFVLD